MRFFVLASISFMLMISIFSTTGSLDTGGLRSVLVVTGWITFPVIILFAFLGVRRILKNNQAAKELAAKKAAKKLRREREKAIQEESLDVKAMQLKRDKLRLQVEMANLEKEVNQQQPTP